MFYGKDARPISLAFRPAHHERLLEPPALAAELDEAVAALRAALVARGNGANVPADPSSAALG